MTWAYACTALDSPLSSRHKVIKHLREIDTVSTIGLWGRSMGAVTALLHGDRDPSIGSIVIDSPFCSLRVLVPIHPYLRHTPATRAIPPRQPPLPRVLPSVCGVTCGSASPAPSAARVFGVPFQSVTAQATELVEQMNFTVPGFAVGMAISFIRGT